MQELTELLDLSSTFIRAVPSSSLVFGNYIFQGGLRKALGTSIPFVGCEEFPIVAIVGNVVVIIHSCKGRYFGDILQVIPYCTIPL